MNDMSADTMLSYLYGLPEQFVSSLEMKFDFVDRYRKNYSNIVWAGQPSGEIFCVPWPWNNALFQ